MKTVVVNESNLYRVKRVAEDYQCTMLFKKDPKEKRFTVTFTPDQRQESMIVCGYLNSEGGKVPLLYDSDFHGLAGIDRKQCDFCKNKVERNTVYFIKLQSGKGKLRQVAGSCAEKMGCVSHTDMLLQRIEFLVADLGKEGLLYKGESEEEGEIEKILALPVPGEKFKLRGIVVGATNRSKEGWYSRHNIKKTGVTINGQYDLPIWFQSEVEWASTLQRGDRLYGGVAKVREVYGGVIFVQLITRKGWEIEVGAVNKNQVRGDHKIFPMEFPPRGK